MFQMTSSSIQSSFVMPEKHINTLEDIKGFLCSQGYTYLMGFIEKLNNSVRGKTLSDARLPESPITAKLLEDLREILKRLQNWISDYPPIPQPMRFGNKAFRQWIQRMENESDHLLEEIIPEEYNSAIIELGAYFRGSFGNSIRIDYGTGHELFFITFLTCLDRLGLFQDLVTYNYLGLTIFNDYLSLTRQLQLTYVLEPAGSHGVWGLDDYQFMPFLLGSSQLIGHSTLSPESILCDTLVNTYSEEFMYFAAIKVINSIKHGPFHEHSPILYDISGVSSWEKINSGLIKMFITEVLKKLPIMQHFVFGTLIPYEPSHDSDKRNIST
jgi:serine/threonine-protein phosphatase 2A activator